MFKKLRDTTATAYPDGDLINQGYGYTDPSPFITIEELTNSDLFNTETLNRITKNIFENDNEIATHFNAVVDINITKGSSVLYSPNLRNFEIASNDIVASGLNCYTDRTTLSATTDNYLRIPTGALIAEDVESNKKIVCVKPQLNILERQIKKALRLSLRREINNVIIEERVEIKYSEDTAPSESLFMCKIVKILDAETYVDIYFGADEAKWNSNDFSSSTYITSLSLILAINNYTDADVNFRGDLYIACGGSFEVFRGEEVFVLGNNNCLYFDIENKEFRVVNSGAGLLDISVPIVYITGVINGPMVISNKTFLLSNQKDFNTQRIPVVDVSIPEVPITLSNYDNASIINNGSDTNFVIASQYFLYEDFFTGSNKKGFAGTNLNNNVLEISGSTISENISISFNLKSLPLGEALIKGFNGATNTFIISTSLGTPTTFSCNADYSSFVNKASVICNGELVGEENLSIKSITRNDDIGYHFYIILDLTVPTSSIQFLSTGNQRQFANIRIYDNENIINENNYYEIISNEFYGLMLYGTEQLITKNEYMKTVTTGTITIEDETVATIDRAVSGEDIRSGLSLRTNETNLSLNPGSYADSNFVNNDISFANEFTFTNEIDHEIRGAPSQNWISVKNSSNGKIVVACSGSTELNFYTNGNLFVSEDYGVNYTQVSDPVDKPFKKVYCDNTGQYMAACSDYVYTSSDFGTTWTTTSIQSTWTDVYISNGGKLFVACNYLNSSIWSSSDYGATWDDISFGVGLFFTHLTGNGSETLFVTADNDYIYYSLDSGANWSSITSLGTQEWQAIKSTDDSTLFAIQSNFMIVTKDFGASLIEMELVSYLFPSILSCSSCGKYIVINSTDTTLCNSLYISRNYGKTFEPISCIGSRVWTSISLSGDGEFIIAAENSSDGLFLSVDNGYDFQEVTYVTEPNLKAGCLYIGNSANIIVSGEDAVEGIYNNNGPVDFICNDAWIFDIFGGIIIAVPKEENYIYSWDGTTATKLTTDLRKYTCVSASSSTTILVGTEEYLYLSTDSGSTWVQQVTPGIGNWISVASDSTGANLYAINGLDQQHIWHNQGGGWFSVLRNGATFFAVACSPNGIGVLAAETNGLNSDIYFSQDGGSGFNASPLSVTGQARLYMSKSSDYGFVVGSSASIYLDGTAGWFSPVTITHTHIVDIIDRGNISPNGQNIIIGSSLDNTIYYSDAPTVFNSFSQIFIPKKKNFTSLVSSDDGEIIYGIVSTGYIYKSIDNGDTWKEIRNAGTRDWQDINCSSDGTLVIAISDNIYISRDAGEYWTFTGLYKENYKKIDMSPTGQHIVIINETNLYVSHDYGFNWEITSLGLGSPVDNYSCSISDDGEVIYYLTETKGNTVP